MIDGNKIRCYLVTEQYATKFTRKVEEFCKRKQIIDIKYTYFPSAGYTYSALITYYVEN